METFIDQQIKADEIRRANEKVERERIEALRVQAIQDKIAAIRGFVAKCQGISADRIANGIDLVAKLDTGLGVFLEYQGEAMVAQAETLKAMRTMYDSALSREAEAARVEAQRLENERIAEQQHIQAVAMAAQQAALDKAAADIKAEQDRLELRRIQGEEIERLAKELVAHEQSETAKALEQTHALAPVEPAKAAIETVANVLPCEACGSIHEPGQNTLCDDSPLLTDSQMVKFGNLPDKAEPATPPALQLGQICERLGFEDGTKMNITADILKNLGFNPAATDKASKLFHERDFNAICDALVHHIKNVQFAYALQNVSVK